PQSRSLWASWNCVADSAGDADHVESIAVTYNMNKLQGIDPAVPLFVTLRPFRDPRKELVYSEFQYRHPQYTKVSIEAQSRISQIQGQNCTTYAGAYVGMGFHEDAFGSGINAAALIGVSPRNGFLWKHPFYPIGQRSGLT